MPYPIRISESLVFQPVSLSKKHFQRWVEPVNGEPKGHFEKSDTFREGLKPVYTFKLADGKELELSRDQVSQLLMTAFDAKKHWKECQFVAKSNGKQGLEKRWFINLVKENAQSLNVQSPVEIEVGGEKIPF